MFTGNDDIDKLDVNSTTMWSQSTDLLFNEAKFVHIHFWAKSFSDLNSRLMENL